MLLEQALRYCSNIAELLEAGDAAQIRFALENGGMDAHSAEDLTKRLLSELYETRVTRHIPELVINNEVLEDTVVTFDPPLEVEIEEEEEEEDKPKRGRRPKQ